MAATTPVPGSWGEFIDRCNLKGSVNEENGTSHQPFWFIILYILSFILVLIVLNIAFVFSDDTGKELSSSSRLAVIAGVLLMILSAIAIGGGDLLYGKVAIPRPKYAYVSWTALLSLIVLSIALCCFIWLSFLFLDEADAYFDAKLETMLCGKDILLEE